MRRGRFLRLSRAADRALNPAPRLGDLPHAAIGTSARAAAPRPKRVEPQESVHRLEGRRPLAARRRRSQDRRAAAEGAGPPVRRRPSLRRSIRAQRTLALALVELGQTGLPEFRDQALNERHYGDLCGLNKDDARKKWGEEQVHLWRRSYDVQPPGGESLKDTVARALPYYCQNILPAVLRGERVLVAAHGNSLRALVMVLDRLTPKTIPTHGAGDRRAAGLPPQRRFDRRVEGRADGLTRPASPVRRRARFGGAISKRGELARRRPIPASRRDATLHSRR